MVTGQLVNSGGTYSLNNWAGTLAAADSTPPSVTISGAPAIVNSTTAFPITITFSESVTGFALGDLSVTSGTASNLQGSGANYTADITPDGNNNLTLNIAAGAAQDAAGNNSSPTSATVDSPRTPETGTSGRAPASRSARETSDQRRPVVIDTKEIT